MKKYLKLYPHYVAMCIKTKLSYKVDAIIGIVSFLITNIVAFSTLYLTISSIPSLNGWTFEKMAFLYGFCLIPKSIDHILTDAIWWLGGWSIRKGDLDKYLIKPLNPLFQLIADDFQYDGLGELILGIFLLVVYGPMQTITWSLTNVIPLIVCGFFAIFIFTAIKLIFASVAFWTKRSIELMTTIYELSSFTKYPINIFNRFVKVILVYIIPFSLAMYYPIDYLYRGESIWILTLAVAAVTILLCVIAYSLWHIGLKKYESAGN